MRLIGYCTLIACVGSFAACATAPPIELVNARQAFQQAKAGPAAELVPAELHKAELALAVAEAAFKDDPESFRTNNLAYVADRKAKLAEALASTARENASAEKANKDYQAAQAEIVKNTKEELAASERNAAASTEQLAATEAARLEAERRAAGANAEAARAKETADAEARRVKAASDAEALRVKALADTEARRLTNAIIVLEKGKSVVLKGVTFETNRATLRAESESILTKAYNALVANPDAQVEISGHTDNVGSEAANQALSLKRAQSVRNWLVQKGIASNRMNAVGKGENEPVASNDTDAGRADNRRIEFFVQK